MSQHAPSPSAVGPLVAGHTLAPPSLPSDLIARVGQRGWLESYSLAYLLIGAAVMVLAGWVVLARRTRGGELRSRSRAWAVRSGLSLTVLTLVLAGIAVAVNAYVGYIPDLGSLLSGDPVMATAADGTGSGSSVVAAGREVVGSPSQVVTVPVGAARDHVPLRRTYVYLPAGYGDPANAQRRYPVVYLVHGYPGGSIDWFRAGRLQQTMDILVAAHRVGPMIVVAPDVNGAHWNTDGECLDSPGAMQLEDYLAFAVPNAIDATFRTIRTRVGRAIGGMSSGAFCALNAGLHHPHRFSVILASGPYGDPGDNAVAGALHGDRALGRANSPSYYLPLERFTVPTAVFLDAGTADHQPLATCLLLGKLLVGDGQQVAIRLAPKAGHTWYEARVELPYSLVFAWQEFGRMPDGGSDQADQKQYRLILAHARAVGSR